MPESFIAAIVVLVIALIALASWKALKANEFRPGIVVAVLIGLSLLFVANASFNTVPVRNVGIVTQFHTPTGETTGSGVHWVKPWDKIEEWDANYELWDHTNDNDGKGMLVKIAGNQDAWVPVSVEYAPNPENAPQDFKDYARNRDNWIERRVYPTLTNAVTNLFRTHDPLAKSNVDTNTGQVNPPDMRPYKDALNAELKKEDLGFNIRNLYIGTIVYNDKTTQSLQEYANLVLQNRNLEQENKNQTLKNDITNNQAKVDKQTYCLQISEKNGTNPGLCLLGSGSGVIVNTEKAAK
jgi:regulator of protease activity HflC (stomatin/prohibitin superfamily)